MPDGPADQAEPRAAQSAEPESGSAAPTGPPSPQPHRTPVDVLLAHGLPLALLDRVRPLFADTESFAASLYRHHDGGCDARPGGCPWCADTGLDGTETAAVLAALDAWCAVGWLERGLLGYAPGRHDARSAATLVGVNERGLGPPTGDDTHEQRLDTILGRGGGSTVYDRDGNPITAARYIVLLSDPGYVRVARHRLVATEPHRVDVELSTAWVGEPGGSTPGVDELPRVFETILFPRIVTPEVAALATGKWRTSTEADAAKAHRILLELLCTLVPGAVVTEVPLPAAPDVVDEAGDDTTG